MDVWNIEYSWEGCITCCVNILHLRQSEHKALESSFDPVRYRLDYIIRCFFIPLFLSRRSDLSPNLNSDRTCRTWLPAPSALVCCNVRPRCTDGLLFLLYWTPKLKVGTDPEGHSNMTLSSGRLHWAKSSEGLWVRGGPLSRRTLDLGANQFFSTSPPPKTPDGVCETRGASWDDLGTLQWCHLAHPTGQTPQGRLDPEPAGDITIGLGMSGDLQEELWLGIDWSGLRAEIFSACRDPHQEKLKENESMIE